MTTLTPAHLVVAKEMDEDALQSNVLDACKTFHWRVVHFRPAKTDKGWRTAVQGDGEGFPDLIALRGSRQLAVELKSMTGRVTEEQRAWLDAFAKAGSETHVFRPSDWLCGSIEVVLR